MKLRVRAPVLAFVLVLGLCFVGQNALAFEGPCAPEYPLCAYNCDDKFGDCECEGFDEECGTDGCCLYSCETKNVTCWVIIEH